MLKVMGNPNVRDTEVLNVSLTPEFAVKVRRVAEAEGRTISELFRECFRTYREKQLRNAARSTHAAFQAWMEERNLSLEEAQQEIEKAIAEVRADDRKHGPKTLHA